MEGRKKLVVSSEGMYLFTNLLCALSVAIVTAADFGVSMIVAPAYILSLKVPFLTFGQAEYVVQGLLFIVLCFLMKKVKLIYFASFNTCFLYGAFLDLWRLLIPALTPEVIAAGETPMALRIVYFVVGTLLTQLAVALYFRLYIYPQVYEFFIKCLSARFGFDITKVKTVYDFVSLSLSVGMTLLFFGRITGIGIGTIVTTFVNGVGIRLFGNLVDKHLEFRPSFPQLASLFDYR